MTEREALVRRGLWLNYMTITYNVVEAVVSLVAGLVAGSIVLVGFGIDSGIDSVIEVTASVAAQWRLRADIDRVRRERVERITLRVIGWSFLALAAYVTVDSVGSLWFREHPERSVLGVGILALSVVVMPVLPRQATRRPRVGQRGARGRRHANVTLCLPVGHRAR